MRTAFDLLDRDQDGMVTPTELQFMLRNLDIHVSDELIDALMKEASKTGKQKKLYLDNLFGVLTFLWMNGVSSIEYLKVLVNFSKNQKFYWFWLLMQWEWVYIVFHISKMYSFISLWMKNNSINKPVVQKRAFSGLFLTMNFACCLCVGCTLYTFLASNHNFQSFSVSLKLNVSEKIGNDVLNPLPFTCTILIISASKV